jgi:dipeptidyl-peptidase-4
LYPLETFKYPKAGGRTLVSLHIYDVAAEVTKEVNLGNYNDFILDAMD